MTFYDDNPNWEPWPHASEDGWDPWDENEDELSLLSDDSCGYCGTQTNLREDPDPFGGLVCCNACFDDLVG